MEGGNQIIYLICIIYEVALCQSLYPLIDWWPQRISLVVLSHVNKPMNTHLISLVHWRLNYTADPAQPRKHLIVTWPVSVRRWGLRTRLMQPSQRDNTFFNFPNVCYYSQYAVPQHMDGVKIWHLVESKYSSIESYNQQAKGFVHRSTSDTIMLPGKQVSVV